VITFRWKVSDYFPVEQRISGWTFCHGYVLACPQWPFSDDKTQLLSGVGGGSSGPGARRG
jgi:hypothetical protein